MFIQAPIPWTLILPPVSTPTCSFTPPRPQCSTHPILLLSEERRREKEGRQWGGGDTHSEDPHGLGLPSTLFSADQHPQGKKA